MTDDEAAILEIEEGFWLKGSKGYYTEHMASSGLCILPPGEIRTRGQAIEGVEETGPWDQVKRADTQVMRHDDDSATAIYKARASRDGLVYDAVVATTYRRIDGEWKAVLHHQTPVLSTD